MHLEKISFVSCPGTESLSWTADSWNTYYCENTTLTPGILIIICVSAEKQLSTLKSPAKTLQGAGRRKVQIHTVNPRWEVVFRLAANHFWDYMVDVICVYSLSDETKSPGPNLNQSPFKIHRCLRWGAHEGNKFFVYTRGKNGDSSKTNLASERLTKEQTLKSKAKGDGPKRSSVFDIRFWNWGS